LTVHPPDDLSYRRDPSSGIYLPREPIEHCAEEYDPGIFRILREMQEKHFWYLGRHRFLLWALRHALKVARMGGRPLSAIDLGGGCGGWLQYLQQRWHGSFDELALGDSSRLCLELAKPVVGESVRLYQCDVKHLFWKDYWDLVFLLDVIEHLPDHVGAVRQVARALRPGGILLITAPALRFFWSTNDELVRHERRYAKRDLRQLAEESGLTLTCARYFMFFLSPLLWLRRFRKTDVTSLGEEEIRAKIEREHRVPPAWINRILTAVFSAETPLGLWLSFPWGTSLLGVLHKPEV
jgi:SAM-dependent methyltransferase